MLAKIAARNRFFPEFWKISTNISTNLGPSATVQAKFGWDLRKYYTFGHPLSPVLDLYCSDPAPDIIMADTWCTGSAKRILATEKDLNDVDYIDYIDDLVI